MEEILLDAQLREELGKGKVKALRGRGFIPAVIYAEGKEPLHLKLSTSKLLKLIHQHRLENAVISLKVKEDKKQKPRACLIKEIQYNPVKGDIIHMDFNEISLDKPIKVNVPVAAKGEPIGVKQEGGSLEHILWEIEVECLPVDIPKEITIDVSQLKMGDSVHIKDISLPGNIKVLYDPELIVLSVVSPMKEEVPVEAVEGEEKVEPEVIKEKKETPAEAAPEEEKKQKEEK